MYKYNYSDGLFPDYIQNRLNEPPPGAPGRHKAILDVSLQMVAEGIADDVIFSVIRNWIPDHDKKDKEIWDAIRGAHAKGPTPAAGASRTHCATGVSYRETSAQEAPTAFSSSGKQTPLPSDHEDAEPFQFLSGLFDQDESVLRDVPE